jgi:hypothetical protein
LRDGLDAALHLSVAAQVDPFESKGLKPVSHFIGSMFETRRFQAVGKLNSTRTVPHLGNHPPRDDFVLHHVVAAQVDPFESEL